MMFFGQRPLTTSQLQTPSGRKYRMLFKNGEMIVSGYQLHSAVSVGTNMDLTPLGSLANPLPTRFRYLRTNIAKAQNNPPMVMISTLPRHYGSVHSKIQKKYYKAILNIRRALYRGSPDDIAEFRRNILDPFTDEYFCMAQYEFAQRALQVLNFHAHTIQLLFRRNAEQKQRNRALVIHYLLEQQTHISYLQNEYVLRNILSFSK